MLARVKVVAGVEALVRRGWHARSATLRGRACSSRVSRPAPSSSSTPHSVVPSTLHISLSCLPSVLLRWLLPFLERGLAALPPQMHQVRAIGALVVVPRPTRL
jgi:hypothetical protein